MEMQCSRLCRANMGAGVGLIALLTTAASQAQELASPWYAGIELGSSHVEVYRASWIGFGTWETGPSDSALQVVGGYRFNDHFAVELSYLPARTLEWREQSARVSGLPGTYDSLTSLSISALQLKALGIWPFAEIWDVYVAGGLSSYRADADQTITDFASELQWNRSTSTSATDLVLGIGIGVTVATRWRLRAEYQFFFIDNRLINVEADGDPTVDSWVFGVDYRFGSAR